MPPAPRPLAWIVCSLATTLAAAPLRLDSTTVEIPAQATSFLKFCQESPPSPGTWDSMPDSAFRPTRGNRIQFGVQSCWVLLRIPVEVHRPGLWHLQNLLPTLDLLRAESGGSVTPWTGADLPFPTRADALHDATLDLDLSPDTDRIHLLLRDTLCQSSAALRLVPANRLQAEIQNKTIVDGLALGFMATLLIMGVGSAIVLRNRTHALYALHVALGLCYLLVMSGHGFPLLWPTEPWINQWVLSWFATLSIAALGWFASSWMNLELHWPRLRRFHLGLGLFMALAAATFPLSPWLPELHRTIIRSHLLEFAGTILILSNLVVAVRLSRKGVRRSGQFLVAVTPFTATAMLGAVQDLHPFGTSYVLQTRLILAGIVLESLLLGWFLFSELASQRRRHAHLLRRHRSLERSHSSVRTEVALEERRGLARDLHDDLGQRIAALRLTVAASPSTDINRIDRELSTIQASLRSLTHRMHPGQLEREGLAATLAALAKTSPIPCTIHVDDAWSDPVLPEAIHLLRMAQEMTGNALKHARATRIEIRMTGIASRRSLEVEDDGIGFDPGIASGLGIPGLRERASILEATIALDTAPGTGCRWRIEWGD
jgi:signal transduction histidine kinase